MPLLFFDLELNETWYNSPFFLFVYQLSCVRSLIILFTLFVKLIKGTCRGRRSQDNCRYSD